MNVSTMTQAELETEALKLRAGRIERQFAEHMAERAARGNRRAGLEPGWSDGDRLPRPLRAALRFHSRRARARGRPYQTTVNGQPCAVLGSGRIVVFDGDA